MGFNELIIASFVGEEELVSWLLKDGMDPDQKDHNGCNALWWAKIGWAPDVIVSSLVYSLVTWWRLIISKFSVTSFALLFDSNNNNRSSNNTYTKSFLWTL